MFKILQVNELPFMLNEKVSMSKNVQISYIVKLLHQKNVPSVCLNFGVKYLVDGNEMFHGGAQIFAEIPSWLDISGDEDAIRKNPGVLNLLSYATIFVSGQVFRFSKERGLGTPAIPYVEPDKLIEKMAVSLVDRKA